MCPRRVLSEDDGIEVRIAPDAGRAGRIAAEWIVGAGSDVVVGECGRSARSARGLQIAGRAIEDLGGIEPELVGDDQLARAIVERSGALGVALRGGVGLVREVEVIAAAEPFCSVSRPSHITVLRKARFVAGSGRRKSESSAALAYP